MEILEQIHKKMGELQKVDGIEEVTLDQDCVPEGYLLISVKVDDDHLDEALKACGYE